MTATTLPISSESAEYAESPKYRKLRMRIGSGLLSMGLAHIVAPDPFIKIIPNRLPNPRVLNWLAAAAELTAGTLLLTSDPKKQRLGGVVATATLVAVYPANIDMALKAGKPTNPKAIATWARLPMQFPMIRSAYLLAKGDG